ALFSARPYAASWNDGSRLATVESLVERHTFRIDDSLFVKVPPPAPDRPAPYPPADPLLSARGTADKLLIGGHYYSDKSPRPAVLLAGAYQAWLWAGGPAVAERPDHFCYWLTVLSSGLAYAVAAWSVFRLGRVVGLELPGGLLLTAAFGLATVALPYA